MIKCGVYTDDRVVKGDTQHRPIYWVIFKLGERIFYILEKECKRLYSTKFYLKLSGSLSSSLPDHMFPSVYNDLISSGSST